MIIKFTALVLTGTLSFGLGDLPGSERVDKLKVALGINIPIILQHKVTKDCPLTIRLKRPAHSAYYCNNKIYLGDKVPGGPVGSLAFILAHEWGHHIEGMKETNFLTEQVADCYAGKALRQLVTDKVISDQDYKDAISRAERGRSRIHGTSKQRRLAVLGTAKACSLI